MASYKKYEKNGTTLWLVKGYLGQDKKTGIAKYTTLRGFERKADAREAFDDARYEYNHSVKQRTAKHRRLIDVYDEWWPMYRDSIRPTTVMYRDEQLRNAILPTFGDYYIDEITLIDVQKWANAYSRTHKAWRGCMSLLSMMLTFCIRMGWLTTNPAQYVTAPRMAKKTSKNVVENHYSLDETKQFIAALNKATLNDDRGIWARRRACLLLILATGMRRGEVVGLQWSDIDFERRTINIHHTVKATKTREESEEPKTAASRRLIPIDDNTRALLTEWRVEQSREFEMIGQPALAPDRWVITAIGGKNKPIALATPQFWMREVHRLLGMRYISPHGLRHTKATLMAEDNVAINDIAAILGHADASFTLREYVHSTRAGMTNAQKSYGYLLKSLSGSVSGSDGMG